MSEAKINPLVKLMERMDTEVRYAEFREDIENFNRLFRVTCSILKMNF